MVGKRLVNTGGAAGAAAFDPLQNFETVTYTGNGGTQKITGYIRKGAAFGSSTTSQITLPDSIDSDLTASISFWFKLNEAQSTYGTFLFYFTRNGWGFNAYVAPDRTLTLQACRQSDNTIISYTSSASYVVLGDWYHICITRSSNEAKYYINGSLVQTDSYDGTRKTNNYPNSIGNFYSSSYETRGVIDQFRVFNKALSQSEVDTLNAETYASSTKSTTDIFNDGSGVALYELDEDANDTDGVDGKFNNAAIFNSTNGRINTNLVPTYNSFTASLWLYVPTGQALVRILSSSPTGLPNPMINVFYGSPLSDDLTVQIYDGTANVAVTKNSIPTNTWFHLAFSYTSGGLLKGYYNGVEFDSNSIATLTFTNTSPFYIGYNLRNDVYGFNGRADQVRMYSAELTSQQISDLASETNIPTNNLLLHYKLDGNANDETGNYNGTAQNITYTGYNGTPTNVNFLGMAFQPDLVWLKNRDQTDSHRLHDSIRGAGYLLQSDLPNAEVYSSNQITSFDTNGFTLGSANTVNTNGEDYVAWCWKAADTTTTIAAGTVGNTIASDVRANQAAGFSIVSYTATSSSTETAGHGLSSTPELVLIKRTSSPDYDWIVYTNVIDGSVDYLILNSTAAKADTTKTLNSTVFTTPTTGDFIAYCFHSVDGYQKVGSFVGDGSTDAVLNLGFEPRWIMIKNSDTTTGWFIMDVERNNFALRLKADSNVGDSNVGTLTTSSTGITISATNSDGRINGRPGQSDTMIYLAIA